MEVFLTQLRAEEALWVSPHAGTDASRFEGRPHSPLGLTPPSALAPRDYPRAPFQGRRTLEVSCLSQTGKSCKETPFLPLRLLPRPDRNPRPSLSEASQSAQGTIRGSSFERRNSLLIFTPVFSKKRAEIPRLLLTKGKKIKVAFYIRANTVTCDLMR